MNIRITYNWLLEYLDTDVSPQDLQKYLSLCGPSIEKVEKIGNDYAFEIEVTSNRIDMASVMGIAREASAILPRFGKKAVFKQKEWKRPELPISNLNLHMEDMDELTKSDYAIILDGIAVKPSPNFIKERLEASGIRSLNNLIDITNYVMLEVGHPTHIFDYDRVKTGKLIFRYAKEGEQIKTLDGKFHKLHGPETDTTLLRGGDIVIDDGSDRIIDLPAIMGLENSVVTENTKRAIYFIDNLRASDVRKTSMNHGIRTLAATYNEKSPDSALSVIALNRGLDLFQQYAALKSISKTFVLEYEEPETRIIQTTLSFISSRMGVQVKEQELITILENLGFKVDVKNETFIITVPTYRADDVSIPEDIVEEVARIYGYHNLPAVVQSTTFVKQPKEIDQLFSLQQKAKYFLKHIGLHEVMNYSMLSKEQIENAGLKVSDHLKIKNPISEEIEYMRMHLTLSLLKNIKDNEGKRDVLKFFEIAKIYTPQKNDLPREDYRLGIAVNTSFSDLKGVIDALFKELNISVFEITKSSDPLLHQSHQGEITIGREWVGRFGEINPVIKNNYKINSSVFVAFIKFEDLIRYYRLLPTYRPPISFATIKLDLTFEPKTGQSYAGIIDTAHKTSPLLQTVELAGTFEKKLTLRFYFASPERNITEEEAKRELEKIKQAIHS